MAKVQPDETLYIRLVMADTTAISLRLAAGSEVSINRGQAPIFWSTTLHRGKPQQALPRNPILQWLLNRLTKVKAPAERFIACPTEIEPKLVNEEDMRAVISKVSEAQVQSFDKGATYTTVTMVAGYAGFIALWDKISPQLSPIMNASVGMTLGVSLATFVLYEVFKMYVLAKLNEPYLELRVLPQWEQRLAKLAEVDAAQAAVPLFLLRVWRCVFPVAVGTGLAAIALLLGAMVHDAFAPLLTAS